MIYRVKYETNQGLCESFVLTDNEFEAIRIVIESEDVLHLKDVFEINGEGIFSTNIIRKKVE